MRPEIAVGLGGEWTRPTGHSARIPPVVTKGAGLLGQGREGWQAFIPNCVARWMVKSARYVSGRTLITGPSGSGKSTLARYFRKRGVNAVDGDEVRGLGGPVDLGGRPLRHVTKEQWRRIEDWRFFWNEAVLKRFLARNPNVVLFGASDNMFDLDSARLFDRRIFLRATWSVIRARLNSPARDNDWGRNDHPAQREWVRKATREWPVRAKARGFEFINAQWSPRRIFREVCGSTGCTSGSESGSAGSTSSKRPPRPPSSGNPVGPRRGPSRRADRPDRQRS